MSITARAAIALTRTTAFGCAHAPEDDVGVMSEPPDHTTTRDEGL
jgi:hypothetical protein